MDFLRDEGSLATEEINVQNFNLVSQKSIVLFIGDAMGTAYRDASRIVSQSTANRFREGWFDELQQMDKMPVTEMSMTYSLENIVPDSANTKRSAPHAAPDYRTRPRRPR